jgi:hypothetical protein
MTLRDPDYPYFGPLPDLEVRVHVEPDVGFTDRPRGICNNCGGPTDDAPIWVAIGTLEDPENLDELCSWGCALELCAGVMAHSGQIEDLRPNITVRELER